MAFPGSSPCIQLDGRSRLISQLDGLARWHAALSGGYVREDVGVIKVGIPGGGAGRSAAPPFSQQKIKRLSKRRAKATRSHQGFIDLTGRENENTRRKDGTRAAISSEQLN